MKTQKLLDLRWSLAWMILSFCLGCAESVDWGGKGVSSDESELRQALRSPGTRLGLRVVRGVSEDQTLIEDPVLLMHGQGGGSTAGQTIEGENHIVLGETLFLSDPLSDRPERRKRTYFVFSNQAFGVPLTVVRGTHRVLDAQRQRSLVGLREVEILSDPEARYRYISLSSLYEQEGYYRPQDVKPDDIQQLTLELGTGNGPNVTVQIEFRVAGPIPAVELLPVSPPAPQSGFESASAMVREISRNGIWLPAFEVRNPTRRPLQLFLALDLNAAAAQAPRLTTLFHHTWYVTGAPWDGRQHTIDSYVFYWMHDLFRFERHSAYHSFGPLQLSEVRLVSGAEQRGPVVPVGPSGQIQLSLEADERATLEFHWVPAGQALRLEIPVPTFQEMNFFHIDHESPRQGRSRQDAQPVLPEGMVRTHSVDFTGVFGLSFHYFHTVRVPNPWSIVGSGLSVSVPASLRYRHPFETQPVDPAVFQGGTESSPSSRPGWILNQNFSHRFGSGTLNQSDPWEPQLGTPMPSQGFYP